MSLCAYMYILMDHFRSGFLRVQECSVGVVEGETDRVASKGGAGDVEAGLVEEVACLFVLDGWPGSGFGSSEGTYAK